MSLTVSKYKRLESFVYCWKFYFYEEEPARVAFLKSGHSRLLFSKQCSIICLCFEFSVNMFLQTLHLIGNAAYDQKRPLTIICASIQVSVLVIIVLICAINFT